jgi:predicted peptidase
MKGVITILVFIGLTAFDAVSQRYENQIFNEVDIQTQVYLETDAEELKMDIYQPKNDQVENRPLLLFVHGGGFAGGARDEYAIMEFCKNMARRGIVAVSMSYTLTMKGQSFGCNQAVENKMNTFKQSGIEISEATVHLLNQTKELRIDPSKIILTGSSAGAEAVLHAAFWPEANTPLPEDFQYGGLISMAGAVYDLDLINKKTAIPMQFFHGTCDNAVPYGTAPHHYCDESDSGYLLLHGAGSIVKKLEELHQGYYLVTGCNGNHSWSGKPFFSFRSEIADFVYHDVVLGKFRQHHQVIKEFDSCQLVAAPDICLD